MKADSNGIHPFSDSPANSVTGPDHRKVISLKEKGKEYRAINDKEKSCVILQIDGGIISGNTGSRCDKGLIVIDDNTFYLVELKGVDLSTACIQLRVTLDYFQQELKVWDYDYRCRAVVAKMPSSENYPTSYRILKKRLKDKLLCKSRVLEEHI